MHAVYLIGLQAEWIFDQALEIHPIEVGPPEQTTPEAIDPDEQRAEVLEILQQLVRHPDAIARQP